MSDDTDKKYKVGYGKPPTETQFKPGKSGNPKGRPKGSVQKLNSVIMEALSATIPVFVNGKKKHMTMLQALVNKLMVKAINGDVKAANQLLKLIPAAEADATAWWEGIRQAQVATAVKSAKEILSKLKPNMYASSDSGENAQPGA
jgi:hypothetical protein